MFFIMALEWRRVCMILGLVALCFLVIPIKVDRTDVLQQEEIFANFIKKFNKTYEVNSEEYSKRFNNFKISLEHIEELNRARSSNQSAIYGLTKYSDLSTEEFVQLQLQPTLYKHIKIDKKSTLKYYYNINKRALPDDLPMHVDWREKKVITEVQNQKTCGACWAFSTAETVEAMYAIRKGILHKLSVQEGLEKEGHMPHFYDFEKRGTIPRCIPHAYGKNESHGIAFIDCAGDGNLGCEGGDACSLLKWLVEKKIPIELESEYPLTWKTQHCKLKGTETGVQIAANFSCEYLVGFEDEILKLLANHGPVAVSVNAVNWQNYLGGIIQFHCDGGIQNINHAVQIVGYDRNPPVPHYIVRNSWGTEFGDNGYLYIAIGSNLCGLATEVSSLDIL